MKSVRKILLNDRIENSYGLYLLDENASIVRKGSGGLIIKDENVFPFGEPESVENALKDIGFPKNLFFFAWGDKHIEILKRNYTCIELERTYLFTVPLKNFRGKIRHKIIDLDPNFSDTIAHFWDGDDEWTKEYVKGRMKKYPFFGVKINNDVAGWIGLHWISEKVASMGFLYVKEEYRHRGIAESLTARMVEELYSQDILPTVHIKMDNVPSLNLGKKLGFVIKSRQYWGGCDVYQFSPVGIFTGEHIEIKERYKNCIRGLKKDDKIKVIFVFHKSKGWEELQHPHRDENLPLRGVFALRTPFRPNPIGETVSQIKRIVGRKIYVNALDADPKTPIIDIKPFAKEFDCPG